MEYGHLTVVCGPMFAGKTTELLKRILWAQNGRGQRIAVYKSALDTRYAVGEIASHDGLRASAAVIESWGEPPAADHVFFDEVQFFTAPHFDGDIIAAVRGLLAAGIHVTATGIDMDWRGNAFDITGKLLAMADEAIKLQSHCAVCGRPATKILKRVPNNTTLEVGGSDLYEPRCNAHWPAAEPQANAKTGTA